MKKSELLDLIEQYIVHTPHLDIPCSLGSDFRAAAEELLELIEKAGMKPPARKIDYEEYIAIRQLCQEPFNEFHKWDKE